MSLLNRQLQKALKLRANYQTSTILLQQPQTNINAKTTPQILGGPVFKQVPNFAEKFALRDNIAVYTYANLFISATELSKEISKLVEGKTNERVMFLCPNDANYVITLWAIWMSGQIAVPLSPLHPKNILLYYANDTKSKLLITTNKYVDLMQRVAKNTSSKLHVLDDKLKLNTTQRFAASQGDLEGGHPVEFYDNNNALILYTSGTTGSPKGVVLSHKNLNAQIAMLLEAWRWSPNDVLLHTLPLHHVHGIVNALLCPLYIGAKTIMLEKFNANTVWSYLLGVSSNPDNRKLTMYMAVPTIYSKLIDEYEKAFKKDPKMQEHIRNTLKSKIRLMVSGSSPLPVPTYEKWLEISGHRLLERFGMTETGMALSNEYDSDREPGYVGVPLPGVSVRVSEKNEETEEHTTLLECTNVDGTIKFSKSPKENVSGELLVKSEGVFKEYFNRPEATRKELTSDGWFKTGDVVEYNAEKKKFKILGRKSVDIIKSGGYKISALHIETQLLAKPDVQECVVVGLENEKWGQIVAAIVVGKKDSNLDEDGVKNFLFDKLPKYSVPRVVKFVEVLPRNAMGKVNKKELMKKLFAS